MPDSLLRPPGFQGEEHFMRTCLRCGKCSQACPYSSILIADITQGWRNMQTPYIDARSVPCYLCMKCPPVCPSGALKRDVKKPDVRMGVARIDKETCLAYNEFLCRSCYQNCPIFNEAIVMDDQLRPVVKKDKCTGCGICEHVCPLDPSAIVVEPGVKAGAAS